MNCDFLKCCMYCITWYEESENESIRNSKSKNEIDQLFISSGFFSILKNLDIYLSYVCWLFLSCLGWVFDIQGTDTQPLRPQQFAISNSENVLFLLLIGWKSHVFQWNCGVWHHETTGCELCPSHLWGRYWLFWGRHQQILMDGQNSRRRTSQRY